MVDAICYRLIYCSQEIYTSCLRLSKRSTIFVFKKYVIKWYFNTILLSTLGTNFAKSDFSNVITKSLSQNGYYKFPDGFLIQWGYFSGGTANNQSINFPLSFKSCFSLAFSSTTDNTNNSIWSVNYAAIYASYFTVYRRYADAGTIANSSQSFRWIAIGTWK